MKLIFLSICLLIGLCQGQTGTSRFVVQLGQFRQPDLSDAILRCVGTVISARHILAPASCVRVQAPLEIAVIQQMYNDVGLRQTISTPAIRTIIHANYVPGIENENNIALVFAQQLHESFAPVIPRTMISNSTQLLVGWGGAFLNPQVQEVQIFGPQFCNPNLPRTFCSVFATREITCNSFMGSPLITNGSSLFVGFVANNGVCLPTNNGFMLNYHSVNYPEFIEEASTEQLSPGSDLPRFVVNVMNVHRQNVDNYSFRCSGTIISENHVLTTAYCAQGTQTLAIQGTFVNSTNDIEEAVEVTIHPGYQMGQLMNNLAIIKVKKYYL
jgi:hypothetical protein